MEIDLIWMLLLVFLPSAFAFALMFFPKGSEEAMRWWSLFGTAATLGVSIAVFVGYKLNVVDAYGPDGRHKTSLVERASTADARATGFASPETRNWLARIPWIKRFNIDLYLGVDGISLALVLLTTALCFLAMIASWNIEKFVRGYCILFLVLETGMLGTFLALDFFLFYIFWELMLLPMYFLIGVWGGPRREYAAIKFFLYTLFGSVFILIALLAFYFTDVRDFVSPAQHAASVVPNASKELVALRDKVASAEAAANKAKDEETKAAKALDEVNALIREEKDADKLKALREGAEAKQTARDKAVLDRIRAELDLFKAEQDRQRELAKVGTYNTFDLVLLQRVGKAAQQHLNGTEPTDVPAITHAKADLATLDADRKALAELGKKYPEARASATSLADAEKAAQERLKSAQEGLNERLKQPFFQRWFQLTMFWFLFVGFAIKVPVFPFHTWLPDAHVEAPTPISMILAGVLLKLGAYGIIRICYPVCTWAAQDLAWWLALLGIINIVYGAFAAMAQTDFKKLVAYSSISHMGYVILGIAIWSSPERSQYWAWGMNGAMFQMIAHGITSAGMFFLVGVIYDRAHHRNLDNFRGLYEPMPLYGGISAVIFFAAMGLPGMCGFVGEFMVVLATWNFDKTFAVLAAATVVLTAAYILWTLQRVFMGTNPTYRNYADITPRELTAIIPLVALAVLLGVAPALLLNWMEPSVTNLIDTLVAMR